MQRAGVPLDERYVRMGPDQVGEHGAHARWSAMYAARVLKDPVIEDLVLKHHCPDTSQYTRFATIVQEADHLSSAIDRKEREGGDKGEVLKEPLKSLFPMIRLKDRQGNAEARVYPLKPLAIGDAAFPVRARELGLWNLSDAYKELWKLFERESEQLLPDPPVLTVLSLLRKYTAAIPSAVYVNEPDVPLYDHAKTTAAIAHCLLEGEEQEPFLFIEGDLSGIQKFIFSTVIPEQARKGTAKRLRGRSFWLSLLMDAMASEIVKECGLFEPSVLWNTGGHFLILAPNTKKNRDKVAYLSRKVNELLLRRWKGSLSVTLVALPVGRDGIRQFSAALRRIAVLAAEKKRQKFIECDLFFGPEGTEEPLSEFCPVCGAPGGAVDCAECSRFTEIGTKIARARALIKGKGLPITFEGIGLSACYDLVPAAPSVHSGEVHAINTADIPVNHPGGGGFLFMANTMPMDGREMLTFGEMAQLSQGAPRLGYLKADVDNLGKIFAEGFPENDRTISRAHTISSQLQYFFAGHINRLCGDHVVYRDLCAACMPKGSPVRITVGEEDEGSREQKTYFAHPGPCKACRERHTVQKFYITYSGGDDLLVIGPWDATIRLASSLDREFRRFTCENPDITLSAGLAVVSPRLPVARAVEMADGLLEKAKSVTGKNHVAVFDECLAWREGSGEAGLSSLINVADRLIVAVESRVVPKNMLYSFLMAWNQTFARVDTHAFEDLSFDDQRRVRLERKRYLPHLKYMMKRNIRDEVRRREVEEMIVPVFPWIKLPVYWTSLASRRDQKVNGE